MQLVDQFLRKINYLRVSVTDRCDLRCVYCMKEKMNFLPKNEVLSLEEIERLCDNFIDLGVEKIRLTGGEPLVRKNIIQLIQNLNKKKSSTNLKEITLTTNGSLLKRYAKDLKINGINRINVSLDTIIEEKFREITRFGNLQNTFGRKHFYLQSSGSGAVVVVVVPTSGVVVFPFDRLSSAKITTRFIFISDKQVLIMAMF